MSPPVTLPLTSAASPPPHLQGREVTQQPACFYIQFIHSSIQYTETSIYRCIYRISYINLSLLFTSILVWIFHTLSTKCHGGMARGVLGCLWGRLLTVDCIWRPPRPCRESLCHGSVGQSGGPAEPSWAEGGGSDPPKCEVGGGERHAAGPPFRWGQVRGGLTLGHPGLSPSLPRPQACNPGWLQPWAGESVPDGSVLGMGGHHTPLEVSGPPWQRRN